MKKIRSPRQEFLTLKRFLHDIEARFLQEHLLHTSLGPPSRGETLDVAAFVVLAHGAFENFVEGVSLWAVEKIEDSWLRKRRAGRSAASVLLYKDAPSREIADVVTVFDNIRNALREAKAETSKFIANNNGIAPKNLRALFQPLGVDVPSDPMLTASLNALVGLRHQWAHQYRFGARVEKSARDVKATVDDCLKLAEQLAEEANAAQP